MRPHELARGFILGIVEQSRHRFRLLRQESVIAEEHDADKPKPSNDAKLVRLVLAQGGLPRYATDDSGRFLFLPDEHGRMRPVLLWPARRAA